MSAEQLPARRDTAPTDCVPQGGMNDMERETYIKYCGAMLLCQYELYEASESLGHKASADGWRLKMERAIAARCPEYVVRMESDLKLNHSADREDCHAQK